MKAEVPSSLSLSQFKSSVRELPSKESAILREKYIASFVDINLEFYRKNIHRLELHVDGWCYEGYLWDCLKGPTVIPFADLEALMLAAPGSVLVMWDIHSSDKVPIPDYWKFHKAAILEIPATVLVRNFQHLPEDLYVFDRQFTRTLVVTHEEARNGGRLCLLKVLE